MIIHVDGIPYTVGQFKEIYGGDGYRSIEGNGHKGTLEVSSDCSYKAVKCAEIWVRGRDVVQNNPGSE
jgi:hypothetical protein